MKFEIVLGSQSPRRFDLLSQLVPAESIRVCPPADPEEPDLSTCHDWPQIEEALTEIARDKNRDVRAQLDEAPLTASTRIVTADTVIVAREGQRCVVLPKPPETNLEAVVSGWFTQYLLGRTHWAVTSVQVCDPQGNGVERLVRTEVTFTDSLTDWVPWYISTREPRGKAGGYALQGVGSVFVDRVEGSLTNVIGLPLRELAQMLVETGIDVFAAERVPHDT